MIATENTTAAVQPMPHDLLTAAEVISYLRLDVDGRNAAERLRTLMRRQALPAIRRGKLLLFRRAAVDAWLDGGGGLSRSAGRTAAARIKHPGRMSAN